MYVVHIEHSVFTG